jgi:hypothetical protein
VHLFNNYRSGLAGVPRGGSGCLGRLAADCRKGIILLKFQEIGGSFLSGYCDGRPKIIFLLMQAFIPREIKDSNLTGFFFERFPEIFFADQLARRPGMY